MRGDGEDGGKGHYHHGHLVKRRLAIEQNDIAILQMTLNFVAKVEDAVCWALQVSQIQALAVFTNDKLGTNLAGGWVRSNLNQLIHPTKYVRPAKCLRRQTVNFVDVQTKQRRKQHRRTFLCCAL